ncbi:ABC transporter permease [Actinocatenispora rupis]|uniref:ABC transporter permease n=1 Tax=Actinocatenispora rupis TaxID=519421 RepID=A0A8J3NE55_9ACTN|nr:ABC transporter permease [Actinocatenispora rupis]GID12209.1 ABC transporter permease [Actinocatenispora rupis]
MWRFIGRRLLVSALLVFVVSFLTFLLQAVTPGDTARMILGYNYTPEAYHELRARLGLDQPVLVQYVHWLGNALHGDLGTSPISGVSVASEILKRLPVTLSLVVLATAVTALVGVGLGVLGAVRGRGTARLVDVLSLGGYALPNFWLALVLVTVFAVTIPLLPATGYVPLSSGPGRWLAYLILPVTTLVLQGVAVFARHTRDSMRDVLSRDFVTMLRANGIPERSIVFRHALRNAAIPTVTVAGLTFIGLFSGTVFIESVFAMPGLGGLAVQATTSHDLPTIQGVVVVFTVIVVLVNLAVDLAYGWLNPKVRVS